MTITDNRAAESGFLAYSTFVAGDVLEDASGVVVIKLGDGNATTIIPATWAVSTPSAGTLYRRRSGNLLVGVDLV